MRQIDDGEIITEEGGVKAFRNILGFAQQVIDEVERKSQNFDYSSSVHPILDVIKLVGRQVQARYMLNVVISNTRLPDADASNLLFNEMTPVTSGGKSMYDIIQEVKWDRKLSLSNDLILPWPWERYRLSKCITSIGRGRPWREWTQDDNHYVELWLPLGIGFVHGGNHSITTGIIQGMGEIKPEYVYDTSAIYDYVFTDGENYIRREDNTVISPVKNIEFAAIFEIGRMMKERSISY